MDFVAAVAVVVVEKSYLLGSTAISWKEWDAVGQGGATEEIRHRGYTPSCIVLCFLRT